MPYEDETPARIMIANGWQTLRKIVEGHRRYIQYLFVGLVFLVIGASLYANWNALASYTWDVDYLRFALSSLLVSAIMLSLAIWWIGSIRLLGGRLSWKQGTHIWAFTQLAKYLPGGIWNYVGRVVACDRAGVPKSCTVLSLTVETILRIQSATIVFLASLPFWPISEWTEAQLLFVASVLLLGFVALEPRILNRGMNLLLRAFHQPPINLVSVQYRYLLGLLVGHVLTVVGIGGAFYLMVISVYPVNVHAAFPMAGMLAISVISGFLNPLTPHGLGTREGLLIVLLGYYLPLPIAIVIALLCRLWLTVSELAGILLASLLFRPSRD